MINNQDITLINEENNKDVVYNNSRTKLAALLSTVVHLSQSYCVGGNVADELNTIAASSSSSSSAAAATRTSSSLPPCIPKIVIPKTSSSKEFTLSLPLSEEEKTELINVCSRSGVGKTTSTEPVVDLEVRKSWELLPNEFHIANEKEFHKNVMTPLLNSIKKKLECDEWVIDAKLYKLLLYEKGCFFSKHRDNERIENMFGTMVLQLPSVYEGAILRVHSPSHPDLNKEFDFGTPSTANSMNFAAFYADCYHEVSSLRSGSRIALIYNLTATPPPTPSADKKRKQKASNAKEFEPHADPRVVSNTLPRLSDVVLLNQIAKELTKWTMETDEDYSPDLALNDWRNKGLGKVPIKMVAVLSHFYTPSSLLGLNSLKGRDKVVANLLYEALCCRHSTSDIPTLAQSSMDVVMNQKLPRQELDAASSDSELVSFTSALIEEAAKPSVVGLAPEFDVYLSFVAIWDEGEMSPDQLLFTFGPKIPLFPDDSQFEQYDSWPTSVNQRLLSSRNLMDIAFRGLFNGEPEYDWGEDEFEEDFVLNDNWGGLGPIDPDKNSMSIYENELLLLSESVRKEVVDVSHADKRVADVEFLGNGPQYEGRCYGRVALLFWPKANRHLVLQQFPAGKAAAEKAAEK